jgi:hypothetical protein
MGMERVLGGRGNMVQGTTSHRQQRVVTRHTRHLCQLADQYFHIRKPEQFRAMVLEPRYTCEFCGRNANDARNLCYPVTL